MPAITASKWLTQAGWDDVPHLTEQAKTELRRSGMPHLKKAREFGIPSLGAGAIYPVDEDDIKCAPFAIPKYWLKSYGLDVGWKRTACIWSALDRETDCLYLYSEHYRGEAEPSIHATAIKARGAWIPGVIDPAAHGRSQIDGQRLMEMYSGESGLGLNLLAADNAIEAGLYAVWERLTTGRLKVFSTCLNWLAEYRAYHRDENGRIVKEDDHLMDATRYLVLSGLPRAIAQPAASTFGMTGTGAGGDPIIAY